MNYEISRLSSVGAMLLAMSLGVGCFDDDLPPVHAMTADELRQVEDTIGIGSWLGRLEPSGDPFCELSVIASTEGARSLELRLRAPSRSAYELDLREGKTSITEMHSRIDMVHGDCELSMEVLTEQGLVAVKLRRDGERRERVQLGNNVCSDLLRR